MERLLQVSAPRRLEASSSLHTRTAQVVIDTLAAIRVGAEDPTCAGYAAALPHDRYVGRTPEETAYLHGLPTTVLQIDEGYREARGHPAIHVVPAALAVGLETGASGEEFLAAVVAGYDTAVELGLRIGGVPADAHSHGSWPAFGAAIAAANLWGADEVGRRRVLEAMASLPIRPMRGPEGSGATVHHHYVAASIQTAISLARGALHGTSVQDGGLEDYYIPLLRQQPVGETPLDRGVSAIEENYFKFHASCAHIHTAIEALQDIMRDGTFDPEDVARIHVSTYGAAARLEETRPATNLAARFSLPFCLGRILAKGEIGHAVFTDGDLADEQTLHFADLVELTLDPDLDAGYPAARPTRVHIEMRDGREVQAEEEVAFGDGAKPADRADWENKIVRLVGDELARELLTFVDAPSQDWTVRDLMAVVWREEPR